MFLFRPNATIPRPNHLDEMQAAWHSNFVNPGLLEARRHSNKVVKTHLCGFRRKIKTLFHTSKPEFQSDNYTRFKTLRYPLSKTTQLASARHSIAQGAAGVLGSTLGGFNCMGGGGGDAGLTCLTHTAHHVLSGLKSRLACMPDPHPGVQRFKASKLRFG